MALKKLFPDSQENCLVPPEVRAHLCAVPLLFQRSHQNEGATTDEKTKKS